MYLLLSLVFIIFLHEMGHLVAAKLCKCKVPVFSIGFGKPLWKKKIGDTIYQIAPILLGGYCELDGEMKFSRSKYAFTNKTYSQKVFISLAGVIVNVVTGSIAYAIGYYFNIMYLLAFGYYSILLGICNALPIPALDGSYPIFILLEKIIGKKRAYPLIEKIFRFCFKIIMVLNILSIPYIVYLISSKQLI
jgi:membrane-associated protease RseP (regulator of RpoE activity)